MLRIFLVGIMLLTLQVCSREILSHDKRKVSHDMHVKTTLDDDTYEAGYSYHSVSRDGKKSRSLGKVKTYETSTHDRSEHVPEMPPKLQMELLQQKEGKIILETKSRAEYAFTFSVNCSNIHESLQIAVAVPRSVTLEIELNGDSDMYVNCRTDPPKELAHVKRNMGHNSQNSSQFVLDNYHNVSAPLRVGYINMTLIGGLIGVSHVNFSLLSLERNNSIYGINDYSIQRSNSVVYNIDNKQDNMLGDNATLLETVSVKVVVVRTPNVIDTVFIVLVFLMEIIQMVALGSLVEVEDFKSMLRRPLPIVIGLVCQYVIMTLIAYAAAKLLKGDNPLDAAGTFVIGLCPGGSASNIYAYILYGDLPLSLTITLLSYVVAFAMMPFWVYAAGQEFFTDYHVVIPYTDVLILLAITVPSLLVGMLIRRRFPAFIDQLQNILTPVIILVAVGFLTAGIYASLYIFYLLDLKLTIVGCALSFIGYILGAVITLPLRRSRKTAVTMSIEIGMKNTGVGYALLVSTMPAPLGDIASAVTLSAEVASQIPPFIASIVVFIRDLCLKKYKQVKQDVNGEDVTDNEKEALEIELKPNE